MPDQRCSSGLPRSWKSAGFNGCLQGPQRCVHGKDVSQGLLAALYVLYRNLDASEEKDLLPRTRAQAGSVQSLQNLGQITAVKAPGPQSTENPNRLSRP